MVAFSLLTLAAFAVANPLSTVFVNPDEINYVDHFATEDLAINAPKVDLTQFGYDNQVPRAYNRVGEGLEYDGEESYQHFLTIVSGGKNFTSGEGSTLDKRASCSSYMKFGVSKTGSSGCSLDFDACANGDNCLSGNGCMGWTRFYLYSSVNSYVTFWTSDVCNGSKGSVNPACPSGSVAGCTLNNAYGSLRVYAGCHSSYSSNCS